MVLILSFGLAAPPAQASPPVDLDAYLGTWYELARTPNDFQDNTPHHEGRTYSECTGSTAEYERVDPDTVRIVNRCVRIAADGARWEDEAVGYGLVDPKGAGAVLRIAFGPTWARWVQRLISLGGFEYRIFALGRRDAAGQYRWSVVGNSDRDFLFLLARTPTVDDATWREMLRAANEAGLPAEQLIRRAARAAREDHGR